jgi:predicted acetyltransferase
MELIPAKMNRLVFTSLFNIYVHELSEYNPWLATQMNEEGIYVPDEIDSFFTTKGYEPFIIFDEKHPVGFVVFSKQDPNSGETTTCCIDELFIVKTSRHKGIATQIAKNFWSQEKGGVCGLAILKENASAICFWENLIIQYDTSYIRWDEGNVFVYNFKIQ